VGEHDYLPLGGLGGEAGGDCVTARLVERRNRVIEDDASVATTDTYLREKEG